MKVSFFLRLHITIRILKQAAMSVFRIWKGASLWSSKTNSSASLWSINTIGGSSSEPYERVYMTTKYTKIETNVMNKDVCVWVTSRGTK